MSVGIFSEEFFEIFYNLHAQGLPFAKMFVFYGAGFSIGKNFVRILRGSIRGGVAVSDFIRDVILAFIVGYFIGNIGVGIKLFQAMGGEFTDDTTIMFLKFFNAFGINVAALPEFVATMSSLLIGAFIGVIFGFLLN